MSISVGPKKRNSFRLFSNLDGVVIPVLLNWQIKLVYYTRDTKLFVADFNL